MRTSKLSRSLFRLAVVAVVVCGWSATSAYAACPQSLRDRSVEEVVIDHYAAIEAQDWQAVRCNYAPKAFIVWDSGVVRERSEIVAFWQAWAAFLQQFHLDQLSVQGKVALSLFHAEGVSNGTTYNIHDGADTFFIRNGRIRAQTMHGFLSFTAPPQ